MSFFDLEASQKRARFRLDDAPASKKKRSDVGSFRIDPATVAHITTSIGGQERPKMASLIAEIQQFCSKAQVSCPSRATIYKLMGRLVVHRFDAQLLPAQIRRTLYNLADDVLVPGHQLVFCCFNYGGLQAMSFAAALPWLSLYQAVRMRGWRDKSRGPLLAVCRLRGI